MESLEAKVVEAELISVVKQICENLQMEHEIDSQFRPGKYIQSQILISFIDSIAVTLGVTIPNECYIFSNKDNSQLSIEETVKKIIKVAKHE